MPFIRWIPRGRAATLAVYIVRRVLWMIPVLFFVILITFALMHLAPGGPWDREGKQLAPSVIKNLNIKYGLDKPLWQQFVLYVWGAIHFDFGDSLRSPGQQVSTLLIESWPYTFTLGAVTFILLVPIGVGLGVIAALRQNSWADYSALGMATVFASTPNFVVGIILIILLALEMNKLTGGTFYLDTGGLPSPWSPLQTQLIMPVITLGALPAAYIARLTRSSTLEVLRQDFVRTAWAKGLRGRLVVTRHVLKNALIPVVTALGPTFAFLITGSFIVETLFQIPGIGRSFVTSIAARDYTMILGTTLLYAFLIAVVNLIVDILYVFIDPRVRLTD
ncbi:MAG TPA: ABC transporter permease [Candidatus Dormibacteraeota bacterium]|nr:ABC transporter permease [Candidatus Dormibacteraeota bacterium]